MRFYVENGVVLVWGGSAYYSDDQSLMKSVPFSLAAFTRSTNKSLK
jgi:hypothetical protein